MELNENELSTVSGGQVIKSEDGKFFVLPDDIPSFSTREDAESAQKLMSNPNKHEERPPFMKPHHHPHFRKNPKFDIKKGPEELQKNLQPDNALPEKQ